MSNHRDCSQILEEKNMGRIVLNLSERNIARLGVIGRLGGDAKEAVGASLLEECLDRLFELPSAVAPESKPKSETKPKPEPEAKLEPESETKQPEVEPEGSKPKSKPKSKSRYKQRLTPEEKCTYIPKARWDTYLKASEVWEALGVNKSHVYSWAEKGILLTAYKWSGDPRGSGGAMRFDPAQVQHLKNNPETYAKHATTNIDGKRVSMVDLSDEPKT
jgi:hypothetical protein